MSRSHKRLYFLLAYALLATLFLAHAAHAWVWGISGPIQLDTGIKASAAASADFNKDGYADLVLTDTVNNNAVIFLGKPPALYSWSLERSGSLAVGDGPVAISAGALEGQGNAGLVIANRLSNSVSVIPGNGDGTFQQRTDFPVGVSPGSVGTIYDGMYFGTYPKDIYASFTGGIAVMRVDGNGTYTGPVTTPLGSHALIGVVDHCTPGNFSNIAGISSYSGGKVGVQWVFWTPDPYLDMAVLSHYTDGAGLHSEVGTYQGDGTGSFSFVGSVELPAQCEKIVQGYFILDSEGVNFYGDIAAISGTANKVYVCSSPTNAASVILDTPTHPTDILAADFNGDGRWDLAVASGGTTVSFFLGNGDGTFQSRQDKFVPGGAVWLAAADMNGDGLPDIISGDPSNTNISILSSSKNSISLSMKQNGDRVYLTAECDFDPPVPDGTRLKAIVGYDSGPTDPERVWIRTLGKTLGGVVHAKPLKVKNGHYDFEAIYAPKGQPVVHGDNTLNCVIQPVVITSGPADKTITTYNTPAITWQAYPGAKGYYVETAMSKKFTAASMMDSVYYDGANNRMGTLPTLTAGVKTYWRVVALLSDGTSTSVGSPPRLITYVPPAQ